MAYSSDNDVHDSSIGFGGTGFLGKNPATPANMHKFGTAKSGFKTHTQNSKKEASVYNQWISLDKKKLVTWEINNVFYRGKKLNTAAHLGFEWVLAAAITPADKLVVFTNGSRLIFFSIAGTTLTVLSNTSFLSNVSHFYGNGRIDPSIISFNRTVTKLVLIGRNSTIANNALPFDKTLINEANNGWYPARAHHYNNDAYDNSIVWNPDIDIDATISTELHDEQNNRWFAVYRFNINPTAYTGVIASITEQYMAHYYKITNDYIGNYTFSGTTSSVTVDGVTTDTTTSNALNDGSLTTTITPLYNTPFISFIYFDNNNIEQTEISTSTASLAINCTFNRDNTSVTVTVTPPGTTTGTITETESYDRIIEYDWHTSAASNATTAIEYQTISGTSSFDKTFSKSSSNVYTSSITSNNTENLKRKGVFSLTGFNVYIDNAIQANSVTDDNTEVITTGADYDTLGINGNSINSIFAKQTMPFAHTNTDTYFSSQLKPTGDIYLKYHITNSATNPSMVGLPNETKSVTRKTESFIKLTPHSLVNCDNFGFMGLIDKHGNILYARHLHGQYGVKAYKKDFVPESIDKQNEIAAIITKTDDMKGVI